MIIKLDSSNEKIEAIAEIEEAIVKIEEAIVKIERRVSRELCNIAVVGSVNLGNSFQNPRLVDSKKNIVRNTEIKFPEECSLEEAVDLMIKLTKEIPEKTRILDTILLPIGKRSKTASLNIKITAPGFAVRPNQQQEMIVPINDDSNEVIFTLVPLELSEQVIEIEFFKGSIRVGYVLIKTHVNSRLIWNPRRRSFIGSPGNEAFESVDLIYQNIYSMEDPTVGLKNTESMQVSSKRHILHVTWTERESNLLFTIYPANRLGEWVQTIPNIKQDIEDNLRNLNAFLTEVVQQGNPNDDRWDSICFNLQSVGADLFNLLIPSGVTEQVQKWKPGSSVIISTNEQWIPWELMYDGEDFWGKKFIIARYPRLSNYNELTEITRPESKPEKEIKKIVNVIGGDIPALEAGRSEFLFSTHLSSESVQLLAKQPVAKLVDALRDADALHCTCHGHLEPHLLQIAGDKNKTRIENLLPETIQRLPLEPGSLVFANACASTVPVLTFGKFNSFGWKFYQRGAGVFIGTLGAVPVKYAVNFAEIVYRELFNKNEKVTIGQAVARAKEVAASERNLFWLLYCIYGDPDFTVLQPQNLKENNNDD